jgi:hypothetical protein
MLDNVKRKDHNERFLRRLLARHSGGDSQSTVGKSSK